MSSLFSVNAPAVTVELTGGPDKLALSVPPLKPDVRADFVGDAWKFVANLYPL